MEAIPLVKTIAPGHPILRNSEVQDNEYPYFATMSIMSIKRDRRPRFFQENWHPPTIGLQNDLDMVLGQAKKTIFLLGSVCACTR
jgi:hypothetical protein